MYKETQILKLCIHYDLSSFISIDMSIIIYKNK